MANIFEKLNLYFKSSIEQENLYKKYLSVEAIGNELFNRKNYPFHFTASAWILDSERSNTLLIYHKKIQKWIQPGGHADGETNLAKVALKEAFEETGLQSLTLINDDIFDFDFTPIEALLDVPAHIHLDVRYAIEADKNEIVLESAESEGVNWIPLQQLLIESEDAGVLRMCKKTLVAFSQVEY